MSNLIKKRINGGVTFFLNKKRPGTLEISTQSLFFIICCYVVRIQHTFDTSIWIVWVKLNKLFIDFLQAGISQYNFFFQLEENTNLIEIDVVLLMTLGVWSYLYFSFVNLVIAWPVILMDWYLLLTKMQRMYSMFLSDIQQPTHVNCYFEFICKREIFKEVFHTLISIHVYF